MLGLDSRKASVDSQGAPWSGPWSPDAIFGAERQRSEYREDHGEKVEHI